MQVREKGALTQVCTYLCWEKNSNRVNSVFKGKFRNWVYGIYPQLPSCSALIQNGTIVNFNFIVGPVKEKLIYGAGLSPILQQGTMETTTGEKRGFLLAQAGSRSLSHLDTVSEPNRLHIIVKRENNFE